MTMGDNVMQFPTDKPPELLVGPFSEYRVVVEGRFIPLLTGHREGDNVCLTIDHRFGASVPKELAYQVAWLIAQAIAVASGYSHLGADSKDRPFAAKAMGIDLP